MRMSEIPNRIMYNNLIDMLAKGMFLEGLNPPNRCPTPTFEEQPEVIQEVFRRKAKFLIDFMDDNDYYIMEKLAGGPVEYP